MVSPRKKLDIDKKYLDLLGFTQPIYNGTKHNFTIVTYIQAGQVASAIALSQNIAERMPNAVLLVYTLATLSDDEWHDLNGSCNNSKCLVIVYDLRPFPAYVANDEYMHAYRPLIVMDALSRSRTILLLANTIRLQRGTADAFEQMVRHTNGKMCGILGLTTRLQAVSTRTHPKMFDYFETTAENFLFLPMVSMDMVIFSDSQSLRDSVMLPWIRCTLTMECIHPIGECGAKKVEKYAIKKNVSFFFLSLKVHNREDVATIKSHNIDIRVVMRSMRLLLILFWVYSGILMLTNIR